MTQGSTNGIVQDCKYCHKVKVTWDFRVKGIKKADGTLYKGYWKEVDANLQPNGEIHTFERCKGIQEGTIRVDEFNQNQTPVGTQSTLPQTGTTVYEDQSRKPQPEPKPETPKIDSEILTILRKAGELDDALITIAKELSKNRPGFELDKIADRLLTIYIHKKSSERQDIIIKLLQNIDVTLQGLSKQ